MKIKSIKEAKEIAYQEIGIDLNDENRPLIIDEATLDFEWGYVFYYNGKKAIETNNPEYGYIGNIPILVDKIDGSTKFIGGVGKILDSELEEYRELKGYSHSIKFPIKEDFIDKTILEQVKMLFKTGEIFQIKKGINIIKENQLLDIEKFRKIIHNNAFPNWTFEEMISSQFESASIILNSEQGNEFPDELEIFNESTSITLSGINLNSISEDILQLPNLKSIIIWFSELEQITPKIIELDSLEYIEILDSKLGKQAVEMIEKLRIVKNIEIA